MTVLKKIGLVTAGLLVTAGTMSVSATANAEPTCADFGIVVHGQHIVANYVMGVVDFGAIEWPPQGGVKAQGGAAVPGGPGPGFHFPNGFPPGASFCVAQAQSANAVENNNAVKDEEE